MPTLELIIGPEGSGKTKELIKRLQQEQIENKKVFIFKPPAMDRKKSRIFETRMRLPAIPVAKKMDLTCPTRKSQCDVIGIDECQLFEGDDWFLEAIAELLNKHPKNSKKLKIIVAGLYENEMTKPYAITSQLIFLSNRITYKDNPF